MLYSEDDNLYRRWGCTNGCGDSQYWNRPYFDSRGSLVDYVAGKFSASSGDHKSSWWHDIPSRRRYPSNSLNRRALDNCGFWRCTEAGNKTDFWNRVHRQRNHEDGNKQPTSRSSRWSCHRSRWKYRKGRRRIANKQYWEEWWRYI